MSEDEERKRLDRSDKDLDETNGHIDELVFLLSAGALSPLEFEAQMRQAIEDCYVRQYVLGVGGLGERLGESEIQAVIGPLLEFQFEKLHEFVLEIIDGKLSIDQIRARAKLYVASARQAFERGRGLRLGWPKLPAYPGDGTSLCATNCRCHWSGQKDRDTWYFYWILDYLAEHCSSPLIDDQGRPIGCLERAALWNPIVIH